MVSGVCGSLNGSGIYDANNSGDAITGGSVGLCAYGTATGFVYNTGTHSWSWSCTGSNGGSGASCSTNEFYCGDNIVQTGLEACDGQTGCNASCQFDTGIVCHGLIISPNPVYVTQSVTITASGSVWASG